MPRTLGVNICHDGSKTGEVELVREALFGTFAGAVVRLRLSPPYAGVTVDDYFAGAYREDGFATIVVAPSPLRTAFGLGVAGEARGSIIVLSGAVITNENVLRLVRHELGHFVGADEHLHCVMSPYFVADPLYCQRCVSLFADREIELLPGAYLPTPAT